MECGLKYNINLIAQLADGKHSKVFATWIRELFRSMDALRDQMDFHSIHSEFPSFWILK